MLTIYGASDDLIEVEGDINEEWGAYSNDDQEFLLACSDGAGWRIRYDKDGIWRITPLGAMPTGWTKTEGSVADDTNDRVECAHRIEWVTLGTKLARAKTTPPAARIP